MKACIPWIDEGFTSYTSLVVMNELRRQGLLPVQEARQDPFRNTYAGYNNLVKSGLEEPLTTHADHFQTNYAYAMAAYTKGSVFLPPIGICDREDAFDAGMLKFYDTWKFKHPNVNDFIRVMEKESGLELDWYKRVLDSNHPCD
jgi:aminopeptidase N